MIMILREVRGIQLFSEGKDTRKEGEGKVENDKRMRQN